MNILILGSGGREHALTWKIKQSPLCDKIYILPGNGGTESLGNNLKMNLSDFQQIKEFTIAQDIEMIIVGPEVPLVEGIVDFFSDSEIFVVGPGKEGANLEGSKGFAKQFMKENGIPTADYGVFNRASFNEAVEFLKNSNPPYVLKADGLAAGKGVLIIDKLQDAKNELMRMFEGKFGESSATVVIEEFLDGMEFSVFVITDGKDYQLLPIAKDYKRIGEGDTGLNTGGMGAVSPVSFVNDQLMEKVKKRIILPTISGISRSGMDYKGFIFLGLICVNGDPFVIEYNCRLGDPETQVILPRIRSDLVDIFIALKENKLSQTEIEIDNSHACTIVLASGGYPQKYQKGFKISGLDEVTDSLVFQAGTIRKEGALYTNGGRVLALTSIGASLSDALDISRNNAIKIDFEEKYFRHDIGYDL